MSGHRRLSALAGALVAVVAGTAALANWSVGSTGATAYAKASAVGTVTGIGTTPTSSTVTLTWSPPATGVPATGYTVARTAPTTATVCANVPATTCTDTGLAGSTTYTYAITAHRFAWSGVAVTTSATTTVAGTFDVTLVTPGTTTAGMSFDVQLTARSGGVVDPTYTGAHTIAWTGLSASPDGTAPSYPTATVTFAAGVSTTTLSVIAVKAGVETLTATEAGRTGSLAVTVGAAGPGGFAFTSSTVNGVATPCTASGVDVGNKGNFATKVSVRDTYGNVTVAGSGGLTVTLSLTGAATFSLSPTSVSVASGATESTGSATVTHAGGAAGSATVTTTNAGFDQASCLVSKT